MFNSYEEQSGASEMMKGAGDKMKRNPVYSDATHGDSTDSSHVLSVLCSTKPVQLEPNYLHLSTVQTSSNTSTIENTFNKMAHEYHQAPVIRISGDIS